MKKINCIGTVGASVFNRLLLLAMAVGLSGGLAQANTSLFWDANGTQGGTGTWDAGVTSNWDSAATGGTVGVYNNTSPSTITANLGGTAGTLTIATATTINVNNITFAKTGYIIAGTDGTSILNLNGTTPTVDFSTSTVVGSSITAIVQGSNLTFKGATSNQLNLNGNNSGITGTTTLNLAGGAIGVDPGNVSTNVASPTVSAGTNNAFGTSAIQFTSNGSINYRDNGDNTGAAQTINFGNNVVINGGNGSFNVGRVAASTTSNNKTFAFGTLTFDTANTFTFAGSIGAGGTPADSISFSGVSLAANGNVLFSAVNGVASIGAISETAVGSSFTVSTATSTTGTVLNLTGASTYTGATNIQVGTLRIGIANALPTGTTLTLGIASGTATLDLNGFAQTLGGLATAGTAASQSITNSSASSDATLTYNGAGSSTFGGIIKEGTHKTALTVSGGTLTLTGTNTYTGLLTLSGGTLNAATANIDGSSTTNGISFNGGTLQAASGGISTAKAVAMTGAGTFDTNNNNSTLSGNITGSGGALTKAGLGTLVLSGSGNTFSAGLIINNGTVQDGNANSGALGSGNVTFGSSNTPTLDLNGNSATVGLLAGAGTNGVITNSLSASTSTLNLAGSGSQSYGGVIQDGGSGKVVALTLTSGTQTLSGANTYSGATSVNGGILVATNTTGSATGTGALSVLRSGAALAGTGTSSGSSFAIGGTSGSGTANIYVGQTAASGDTNTTKNLTLIGSGASTIANANLTFNLNTNSTPGLAGQGNELVVGSTAITFGSGTPGTNPVTLTLNLQGNGTGGSVPYYVLIAGNVAPGTPSLATTQYAGLSFGTPFAADGGLLTPINNSSVGGSGNLILALNLNSAPNFYGGQAGLYLFQTSGGVDDIVVIPEPTTWAMMLGGLAVLVFIQRRRKQSCYSRDTR